VNGAGRLRLETPLGNSVPSKRRFQAAFASAVPRARVPGAVCALDLRAV
jgi:hypothetical protein